MTKKIVLLLTSFVLGGLFRSAWADSFQLEEQNVANLGTAYAGVASQAEDASIGYYNPAGLTRLHREQVVISGVLVDLSAKLSPTVVKATNGSTNVTFNNSNSKNLALIPAFHYAKRIDEKWIFSLNITRPFSIKHIYRNASIAPYEETRSELETVSIGPSFAYQFNNGISVGSGIDAVYLDGKLFTTVSSGNPATDIFQENTASSWGIGYHIGFLYDYAQTRVGVHYRSKVKEKLRGYTRFGAFTVHQELKTDVELPETIRVSVFHAINNQWAVMADVAWARWKSFSQLVLRSNDGNQLIISELYKNTYRVSLGLNYQYDDQWRLKLGTAFDKTPVQEKYHNVRSPDKNHYWLALGVQYHFSSNLAVDVGYARVFSQKAIMYGNAPIAIGRTRGTQQLFGIQLTWDLL